MNNYHKSFIGSVAVLVALAFFAPAEDVQALTPAEEAPEVDAVN